MKPPTVDMPLFWLFRNPKSVKIRAYCQNKGGQNKGISTVDQRGCRQNEIKGDFSVEDYQPQRKLHERKVSYRYIDI